MSDGSELAVAGAIEACAAGWSDPKARTHAAKQLGLVIDDAAAQTLAEWLEECNDDRRLYTLPLADLLRAIVEASTDEIAVRHGGKGGKHARTPTTVALAVKSSETVVVALGTCAARSASPGTVWDHLAPWQANLSRNLVKARVWSRVVARKVEIPIVAAAQLELRASRVTRDAVLAEVLARPLDDEPRLVYADALTQRGDPRGELIVVQCALAAGSTDPKLVARETKLLRKHGAAWMKNVKQHARTCTIRRGFVASVTMTARQFANGGRMFDGEPIEELVIKDPEARALAALADAPHLARLDRLAFDGRVWLGTVAHLRAFQKFLGSSHLRVRSLRVEAVFGDEVEPHLPLVFEDVAWPTVEHLELCLFGASHIGRRGVPLVTDEWTCEVAWGSLAHARIPKLKTLAIAPYGNIERLRAAFPAAQIERLATRPRML